MNIRTMRDDDIEAVVGLLSSALGPGPGGVDRRSLFEWKHLANPAGRSIGLVGEQDGAICGVRMFMRWSFRAAAEGQAGTGQAVQAMQAVRAVDTATDPNLGRLGVFTSLTKAALAEAEVHEVALVFNTPNEKSRPGYLKMGWSDVARWPVWIRVRRPHRLALAAATRNLKGGRGFEPPARSRLRPALSVLSDPALAALCERASAPAGAFFTDRTPAFLRWRYAEGPIAYHALVVDRPEGVAGDEPCAILIVRLRMRGDLREVDICDVIAGQGESEGEKKAIETGLRNVASEADADHAVGHFGAAWPWGRVLAKSGFRRLPRSGVRFTVRPVTIGDGWPNPLAAESWGLSPGDLELF